MFAFLITTHIIITLILIVLILVSSPSLGATSGMGSNISNIGSSATNRKLSVASKIIMVFAILFFLNSTFLAILNHKKNNIAINIPDHYLKKDKIEESKVEELDAPSIKME